MRNEAELEYEQMCAELDHLRECDKASRKLIAELEAENRIFRNSESVGDSVWDGMLKAIMELQAKLDRVRGIGQVHESWGTSDEFNNGWRSCLEQVQSSLGDEDD